MINLKANEVTEKREKQEDLTAEQIFKLLILKRLLGENDVKVALEKGASVDSLFSIAAEHVVSKKIAL